ncbi:hypothetical protein Ct61P_05766 [Colletotrichum tofieldiae]|nr:hypothetical protein Ct61P_05766 [Colletotrichum tofieldiae]
MEVSIWRVVEQAKCGLLGMEDETSRRHESEELNEDAVCSMGSLYTVPQLAGTTEGMTTGANERIRPATAILAKVAVPAVEGAQ